MTTPNQNRQGNHSTDLRYYADTSSTSTTDPGDPGYHAARGVQDRTEQLMRADFARVYRLDQERDNTYTDAEYVQLTEQMHALSEPWVTRNDELGETWRDMRTLSADSHHSRAEYADAVEQIEQYRRDDDPLFTRSVSQVGDLKGFDRPRLSSDAQRKSSIPVSSAFAAARTAELGRGNAFSGLSANAFAGGQERKGMSR